MCNCIELQDHTTLLFASEDTRIFRNPYLTTSDFSDNYTVSVRQDTGKFGDNAIGRGGPRECARAPTAVSKITQLVLDTPCSVINLTKFVSEFHR